MSLTASLVETIRASGPITLAHYMERCNAHYYATRDPFGRQGDFITAPEISQIFGELIGAWMAEQWQALGKPEAVFCELGPGRGTLMKDALRATKAVAGFHERMQVIMVENSPVLRAVQARTLDFILSRTHWQETLDSLPPLPLFLIANEFFDALPIAQYTHDGAERRILHDGLRFLWSSERPVVREASSASLAVMTQLCAHIRAYGGAALVIDYGYTGGSYADTLQATFKHSYADPLEHPGEADLTAHVDFAALADRARSAGVHAWDAIPQGLFLKRLGAELRALALCKNAAPAQREAILRGLERLVAPRQMGELFKVLAITSALDKPAGF